MTAKASELDSRPLKDPPRPWSRDDLERDTRRAEAAGFELSEDEWRAHAELGRDAVAEQVKERREAELERLKAQRDELIRRAQEAERDKLRAVIEEALKRRSEKRAADSRPAMKLGGTF